MISLAQMGKITQNGTIKKKIIQKSSSKNGMVIRNPKKNLRKQSWERTSGTTKWDKLGQVCGTSGTREVGLQIFSGTRWTRRRGHFRGTSGTRTRGPNGAPCTLPHNFSLREEGQISGCDENTRTLIREKKRWGKKCVQTRAQMSTTDLTKKILFERLYLVHL